MLLEIRLRDHFSASVRQRGMLYFAKRQVRITAGSCVDVSAMVWGTESYDVVLHWDRGLLSVLCTCPYFMDRGEPCKHLWATILQAVDISVRCGVRSPSIWIQIFYGTDTWNWRSSK